MMDGWIYSGSKTTGVNRVKIIKLLELGRWLQGFCLSTSLFNLYGDVVNKEILREPGRLRN